MSIQIFVGEGDIKIFQGNSLFIEGIKIRKPLCAERQHIQKKCCIGFVNLPRNHLVVAYAPRLLCE